jgi:CDP-2,3-bis-(O-geranylgeranyl)-sn-glycerol synthase
MTASRLLELLYLMLPAYLANMAPPFVKYWNGWNRPINRGWLGEHKTVVGFAVGVLVAVLATYIQSSFAWPGTLFPPSDWLAVGFAQGFGAMGGDVVKSFFKRRRGIAPGRSWIPADQLDFPIGALSLLWLWVRLDWLDVIAILGMTFAGGVVVNHMAFRLGIRDTKW